ncbi:MAG: SusC/RagA family TonB-linked outer membrane protein, partial [Muribaculaceae bacterium]|nr:SusC/RagA family TonB-linked outer membrane protein [Muribaculaceae bacterium]
MLKFSRLKSWVVGAICLLTPHLLLAQDLLKVTGNVTDENGEPLIGASVTVQGAKSGTVTDYDGNYEIKVAPNGTLVFSYIGCTPQSIEVNKRTKIDVTLDASVSSLDEVVVIGYGVQKKVTMTGAVSNVNGKELLKSPSASLGNAMAGKLPGVSTVQYSGRPGGDDPTILVRGVGSFNGSSPLILVDGVERSFSQIDPNEVEDISILKDASATAVFGVRGANGVIIVTTKRGQEGKTDISFSASYGIQQVANFIEMVDSYTWATLYNNAQLGDGFDPSQLRFSEEAIRHFRDGDMPLIYPSMDWLKYVMKKTA